eukprot:gene9448-10437_t
MFLYAVSAGRRTGIFLSWAECRKQVIGYNGARFGRFKTWKEALDFMTDAAGAEQQTSSLNLHSQSWNHYGKDSECLNTSSVCPEINAPVNRRDSQMPVVCTEGVCSNSRMGDQKSKIAGIGVFWGVGDDRNVSKRLYGYQEYERAELVAAITALETAVNCGISDVELCTNSTYTIDCATHLMERWKRNGWRSLKMKRVRNTRDLKKLHFLCGKVNVKWVHLRGQHGVFGSKEAGKLAKAGAKLEPSPKPPSLISPIQLILSAAQATPLLSNSSTGPIMENTQNAHIYGHQNVVVKAERDDIASEPANSSVSHLPIEPISPGAQATPLLSNSSTGPIMENTQNVDIHGHQNVDLQTEPGDVISEPANSSASNLLIEPFLSGAQATPLLLNSSEGSRLRSAQQVDAYDHRDIIVGIEPESNSHATSELGNLSVSNKSTEPMCSESQTIPVMLNLPRTAFVNGRKLRIVIDLI